MDAVAFLDKANTKLHPVYALFGDERFLKRQVLDALRTRVFGTEGDDMGLSRYSGDGVTFAHVHDELQTLPFLCSRRLVIIDDADPFVTRFRASLEKYVANPAASGILVLDVKTWASNTKLYKLFGDAGNVACKAPAGQGLAGWCVQWAKTSYGKQLSSSAAHLLVELVGTSMGLLDQEIAKLATYVGANKTIGESDVDRLVGNNHTENVFKIFDAVAAGHKAEALSILDGALERGEEPIRLLGAFSVQLRRLAQVARLCAQGMSVNAAAEQLAIVPFARRGLDQQLRHLGKRRADHLFDWLLEVDTGLKGGSPLSERQQLERLVVRML